MIAVPELRDTGAVLLTGATGFLGMELLARYIERTDRTVYALVRARDQAAADERIRRTLAWLFGAGEELADRVIAIPGDLESPRLGLADDVPAELVEEVTDVVHAAATVSFELPLPESRQANVEGTRGVLDLCEQIGGRGRLRGVTHVSTAYVAGDHRGRFGEDDLDVGQSFHNGYERSKFEAEQLVRSRAGTLPVRIVRPSIIVGEQTTGWTASFNAIYWPLRAFALSGFMALPAHAGAPVDMVPVDFVADAVFALAERGDAVGRTIHLAAGEQAATVAEIVALAAARFERRAPRLVHPLLYRRGVHPVMVLASRGARRRKLRRSEAFFPYFSWRSTFEVERARAALEPEGIRASAFASYFDRLMDFALRAEWGRRRVARGRELSRARAIQ
jgi:thioester reductase-like protein